MTKVVSHIFKKNMRQILICFGSIIILGFILCLICNGLVLKDLFKPKNTLSNLYYMNYDVSTLNDSKENGMG